jgi:serine/threonine protein kinase
MDPAPDAFGPYEVYERLGVGGMAMVHRAKKRGIEGFERSVALKRIIAHLAEDRNFVDSFIREAKVSSHLHHPNIAQISDFGRINGVYYIAMELVQGFDIRKLLRYANKSGEPIPMPVLLSILGELADALDYAHTFIDEHGQPLKIVHRDISPSNLIIAHSGHLKVIDFGIAKASSVQLHTESGQVKGKLGYMSPESALGMQLEPVSDLFSMGVVAWELVTASPLFSARTDYETMRRIREAEITPPSYHNPSCPPELDAIILSALERDSTRRLPSAGVFRAAIDALATQHGIHHSARHVAEWLTRFAQPGDQWVRASVQPPSSSRQIPVQDATTSQVRRVANPKLQRSSEDMQLAREIWGDEPPAGAVAEAHDFSVSQPSSPLTASVPPLVHISQPHISQPHVAQSQPLHHMPMHTPASLPVVAPKPKRAVWILGALAIVAGVLGALLVVKKMKAEPSAPTVTNAPVHFVVEPAGAAIEIAGKPVEKDVELLAGEHAVTVKQDGFKPWTRSVTVRAGESQTVNVSLERGMAHVTVESDPRGLAIEIDGKVSGYKTPASFDLPAGTHDLVIKNGGEVWSEKLVATVDGKHALNAKVRALAQVPVATNDKTDKKPPKGGKDRKQPKQVAEVKPPDPPVEVSPPPVEVKPPPVEVKPPVEIKPPPVKPHDTRTPVVAAGAVTKLSGEIPKLKSAGGESNGDALVKMCVDTGGKVTSVKVVKSTGAIASDLQSALTSWRYKPYTNKDGQTSAVCFPLQLRLVFKRAD